MLIGVDFDNTIISYDALFHRVALERGLIPAKLPVNKTAVRDHLRAAGREDIWTEMQGEIYGTRLGEALPFAGVRDFFAACRDRGIRVVIISHKTRYPYRGERHDLHAAARSWLIANEFVAANDDSAVFFELTKAEKIARITAAGCTHFIDDLPEILTDAGFPAGVERILFDPVHASISCAALRSMRNWLDATTYIVGEAEADQAANRILARAGWRAVSPAIAITGGANNRVAQLTIAPTADGTDGVNEKAVIVKRYFQHAGDQRDRFSTERAFYAYTDHLGLTQVPNALGWDAVQRVGVFDLVAGIRPSKASQGLLKAALRFIALLNIGRRTPLATALPAASEACFSIAAHLATVTRRIDRLGATLAEDAVDAEARQLVCEVLQPVWEAVESDVRHRVGPTALASELPLTSRCVSPSDFGFHNSLVTSSGDVVFLDFEYAGWDDPAKLVCDFFCQPDVPVPIEAFPDFVEEIGGMLSLPEPEQFGTRCRLLLPVYAIKWACILLNEFTSVGRQRREFSLGQAAASARRERQLARVRALLAELPVPV